MGRAALRRGLIGGKLRVIGPSDAAATERGPPAFQLSREFPIQGGRNPRGASERAARGVTRTGVKNIFIPTQATETALPRDCPKIGNSRNEPIKSRLSRLSPERITTTPPLTTRQFGNSAAKIFSTPPLSPNRVYATMRGAGRKRDRRLRPEGLRSNKTKEKQE